MCVASRFADAGIRFRLRTGQRCGAAIEADCLETDSPTIPSTHLPRVEASQPQVVELVDDVSNERRLAAAGISGKEDVRIHGAPQSSIARQQPGLYQTRRPPSIIRPREFQQGTSVHCHDDALGVTGD